MGMKINAAVAASLLALPAVAAVSEPAGLPPGLRASVDEEAAFVLTGRGDQLFECKPSATSPNGFGWAFTAPDVTLYDGARSVGRHATTNVWESSSDRTSVSGSVRASQPGGENNLPWALFRAIPSGSSGLFAGVTSVQRVNTSGGIAPATGCDSTHTGTQVRAPFTADYYFYKRRGR